jgi:hypothetical protein
VLNRQVVWPFVHALLLLPGFGLFGPGLETPALVSATLFGLTAVLAFAAGARSIPPAAVDRAARGGRCCSHPRSTACSARSACSRCPGAFLLALTLVLHLRCAGPEARRPGLAAAGVSTAALFLLKYNYGMLWLAALIVNEWFRLARDRRAFWRGRADAWLSAGGLFRPLPLFLTPRARGARDDPRSPAASSSRRSGGGFRCTRRESRIRAARDLHDLGWRSRWRATRGRGVRAGAALPSGTACLIATIGVPLLIWFLIPWPNRVRALADFVANRRAGPPRGRSRACSTTRACSRASTRPRRDRLDRVPARARPARRAQHGAWLLYIALAIGFEGTVAHRYHHPRFLFTTALLVWINAARAAVGLAAPLIARAPRRARVRPPPWRSPWP